MISINTTITFTKHGNASFYIEVKISNIWYLIELVLVIDLEIY